MSHNCYNPFNNDDNYNTDHRQSCYALPVAVRDDATDAIERYRRIQSGNSNSRQIATSPEQHRRPALVDPCPSSSHMVNGRAATSAARASQRQDERRRRQNGSAEHDADDRQRRRAERIYGSNAIENRSKSPRRAAAAVTVPMLAEPLLVEQSSAAAPVKKKATAIAVASSQARSLSKQPAATPQILQTTAQAASGNKGLCSVVWLLFTSAAAGYYYGKNGMDNAVGAYIENAMSAIADFRPSYDQFLQESQFNMTDPEDADRWPNNNQGLELNILFAADSKWYKHYAQAVADWNNCSSLSLTMENTTVDPDCSPVDGAMKVCNKDWGATGWNGINYAMVDGDGYISSSVAIMNEYYLKWSREPQKQYVMCHEIGHGFGLPHTDETFYNKDTGNCLDYTVNPRANMHPDSSNYEYLYQLYGSFATTAAPTTTSPTAAPTIEATTANRRLRNVSSRNRNLRRALEKWNSVVADHVSSGDATANVRQGWRRLHKSSFAELHEYRLDEEYRIRAYIVLVR